MQGGTCRGRGAQERRLGWRHQPSVRRVRLPRLEAGLVKPTQSTVLAENARMNEDKGARPRAVAAQVLDAVPRSEEHTSELQSLMRISYAGFCLKKKKE